MKVMKKKLMALYAAQEKARAAKKSKVVAKL